ncbi:MAG TPA: MraY family glycosyltransferase [Aggregatilineales bacterium]|nr:MraY family glycosyltransferase [Aggregatilineales bacterium]
MTDYIPLIVVAFAASLALTPLTRQIARRFGVVDTPSSRKVHQTPIPLMGGLAIYGAFIIALVLFRGWPKYVAELTGILISTTWLAFIGLLDDRMDLRPWVKFPAQALAAIIVIAIGISVDLPIPPFFNWLITFVWIVGIINAINFLDNMDGLAAGLSAICALFMLILAVLNGQYFVAPLAAALCGSAVGFLIYNFNPATTFMGDMGSMVLGFILAVLGIKLSFPHETLAGTWYIPIIVMGLPVFDTTLVVFTRLHEGRSPLVGGRDHTSHRLVSMGLSHRLAVITLYGVCILLGLASIAASEAPVSLSNLIAVVIAALGLGLFAIMEVTRYRYQRKVSRIQETATVVPTPTPQETVTEVPMSPQDKETVDQVEKVH